MKTEKDWIFNDLRCVVIAQDFGHRCGYVGVPKGHECYGKDYDSLHNIEVHGGLTYNSHIEGEDYPVKSDLWWFGYDCAHLWDKRDWSIMGTTEKEYYEKNPMFNDRNGTIKDTKYCIKECESLAKQLNPYKSEEEL